MSILIKGVEMPTSCVDCRFHKSIYCTLTDICTNTAQGCPLVPVPPHGDLIERDKLREKEFVHDGDAYAVVMSRDIRNAPTIIPASEEVYDRYTDTAGNLHWTGTHSGKHIVKAEENE